MSTATVSDNTPVDPDDELLVAYLDGELDRKDQAELENRLLDDQALRQRLQQLQTGWDLLDDLPNPAPSLKLVESTLELVVADIVKTGPTATVRSRFSAPIVVAAACLVGIAAAFLVVRWRNAFDYRQQLDDLAIVEHLDAYNYGGDLALIRQLFADPDWSNMLAAAKEIGDIKIESIANLAATPIDQREQLIRNLPLEKMNKLDTRWNEFNRFDEANRERIRRTAEAVAKQADSEYLLQTMKAYAVWRESLSPELRDKIESGEGAERRQAVQDAIERTQVSISKRSSLKLDDDSIDWIYLGLQQVLRQRVDSGDQPTMDQMQRAKRFGEEHMEFFTISAIVASGMRGGRRPFGRPPGAGPEGIAPLQQHELDTISLALPDRALDILDSVANGDPFKESITISMWAEEAIRRKFPFKRDDSTTLERYMNLDDNERDVLDLLPPNELLNELGPDSRRFRFGPPPRR